MSLYQNSGFAGKLDTNFNKNVTTVDVLAAGDASQKRCDKKSRHDKRGDGKHSMTEEQCEQLSNTTPPFTDTKSRSQEAIECESTAGPKDKRRKVSNFGKGSENNTEQHNTEQISAKPQETSAMMRYKFDDSYLKFVQNFTMHCENRRNLFFDGSIFFDEDFFPRSLNLTEYVPINVIARSMDSVYLQVPSSSEYCKFASCGSTLYDYFVGHQALTDRERILRNQIIFTLNSLQCPRLTTVEIESTPQDDLSTGGYPTDRLSVWNEAISSFISKHVQTLKYLQIKIVRYKGLGETTSLSCVNIKNIPKRYFPKLHQLEVILWDNQVSSSKNSDSTDTQADTKNEWLPNWFPDAADQYWISLMKSQVHGNLTKLCWVSAANLNWNEIFQPILDSNKRLECFQYVEIETMQNSENNTARHDTITEMNFVGSSNSYITSNVVLNCRAFSHLHKLKILSLRKTNCYLTNLNKLPKYIEELAIDDISLKSEEISSLKCMPKLKILRLGNNAPKAETPFLEGKPDRFGVDKEVLKDLLHLRSLQELCVWRHCLGMDVNAATSRSPFIFTSVLEKINAFLYELLFESTLLTKASIYKNSYKISPSQFHKWNSQQMKQDKYFLESLRKFGVIDDEFIVIHCSDEPTYH